MGSLARAAHALRRCFSAKLVWNHQEQRGQHPPSPLTHPTLVSFRPPKQCKKSSSARFLSFQKTKFQNIGKQAGKKCSKQEVQQYRQIPELHHCRKQSSNPVFRVFSSSARYPFVFRKKQSEDKINQTCRKCSQIAVRRCFKILDR